MTAIRPILRIARYPSLLLRRAWLNLRLGGFGKNTTVDPGVRLDYPERIRLGDGVRIAGGVTLRANTESACGIRLGDGCTVQESVLINANRGEVTIGSRSWIGPFCLLYGNGGVRIGDNVLIAAHTSINTVSHHFSRCDIPINDQGVHCDPVVIEDDVWVGMNAVVLQGVTIGRGAIVGAGAVVTRDVPAWSIVMGVPARVVGHRDCSSARKEPVHV